METRTPPAANAALIDLLADYAYTVRVQGATARLVWANPDLTRLTGFALGDLAAEDGWALLAAASDSDALSQRRAALLAGHDYRLRRTLRRKEGGNCTVEEVAQPVADPDGGADLLIHVAGRDISERQQLEARLRTAQQKLEQLLVNAQHIVYRFNSREQRYEFLSESVEYVTGWTQAELMARRSNPIEHFHPDDQARCAAQIERAVAAGDGPTRQVNLQYRFQQKDGSYRWINDWCTVHLDADNRPHAVSGTAYDITEQRTAEEALARSERIYREVIENAQGVPYELDIHTEEYRFLGAGIEALLGVPAQELDLWRYFGLVQEQVVLDARFSGNDQRYGIAFARGQVPLWRTDVRIITPQGVEKWLSDCAVPVRDDTGRVVASLGVFQDVTERKRVEHELREARDELERRVQERTRALRAANLRLSRSERTFRTALQNLPIMVVAYDAARNIIVWNRECLLATGYSAAELRDKTGQFNVLVPDEAHRAQLTAQYRANRGDYRDTRWRIRRKDGAERVISWSNESARIKIPGWPEWAIGVDITERETAQQLLEFRARFDALVARMSTDFINCTPDEVHSAIERALCELADFAHASRAFVLQFDDRLSHVTLTHNWPAGMAVDRDPQSGGAALDNYPGLAARMRRREIIAISDTATLGPEFAVERQLWHDHNFRAVLFVPMTATRGLVGYVGFTHCGAPREWTDEVTSMLHVVGQMFANVLERSRFDEALRASEERLRRVLDQASDGIFVLDQAGHIRLANRHGAQTLGREPDDVVGRHVQGLLADYDPQVFQQIVSTTETGEYYRAEAVACRADGSQFPVEIALGPYSEAGEPRILALVRDVTERVAAEAERRQLAMAIEQSADVVFVTDVDGFIQYVNPAFFYVTGWHRLEVIGRNSYLLRSDAHPDEFWAGRGRVLADGRQWSGRVTYCRKDGSHYDVEESISPVRAPDGRVVNFVAVQHDITQQLTLERQLQQAQKMEALGQLADGVAHDLGNLVTAIVGYTALARNTLPEGHRTLEALRGVEEVAEQAAGVTRGLLTFSRNAPPAKAPVEIRQVIEPGTRLVRRLLKRGVTLEVDYLTAEPLWVLADAIQLQQVLINLIINARDASPSGQAIRVRVEAVPSRDGTRDDVCFSVADRGCGIPEDLRTRIFEPFFTTKQAGGGSGLGLSIVHGILKSHGGWVDVESVIDQGSVFRVSLPRIAAPQDAPQPPLPVVVPPGRARTILLAEQEGQIRAILATALRNLNYRVRPVDDCERFLRRFEAERAEIDLVILSNDLGSQCGWDCLAALRATSPELPAILMTSGLQVPDDPPDEFTVVLHKPFHVSTVGVIAGRLLEPDAADDFDDEDAREDNFDDEDAREDNGG